MKPDHTIIPQVISLILIFINLLLAANLHGKEKKLKEYNFWLSLFDTCLNAALLYWGGFFDVLINR